MRCATCKCTWQRSSLSSPKKKLHLHGIASFIRRQLHRRQAKEWHEVREAKMKYLVVSVDKEIAPVAIESNEGGSIDKEDQQCLESPVHRTKLFHVRVNLVNLSRLSQYRDLLRTFWSRTQPSWPSVQQLSSEPWGSSLASPEEEGPLW